MAEIKNRFDEKIKTSVEQAKLHYYSQDLDKDQGIRFDDVSSAQDDEEHDLAFPQDELNSLEAKLASMAQNQSSHKCPQSSSSQHNQKVNSLSMREQQKASQNNSYAFSFTDRGAPDKDELQHLFQSMPSKQND